MNPLTICAWRCVPWPQKPDGALGRHRQDLSDWHETLVLGTGQEMEDGVDSGVVVTPEACAGAAVLLGQVPWARMIHHGIPKEWTVTAPSNGF